MGLIPKVKCRRCERSYSSRRNRCPYCGARREQTGKWTIPDGDPRWNVFVGVMLLVAIVCTVIAVIIINVGGNDGAAEASPSPSGVTGTADGSSSTDSGVTDGSATGTDNGAESTATTDTASPTASGEEAELDVSWAYYRGGDKEMTIAVGDTIQLTAEVSPAEYESQITWGSTDTSVCTISDDGLVAGMAVGDAYVYAEVGGVQQRIHVIIR